MGILRYERGSLFDAPPKQDYTGSVLVHACNAQGAWGGGPEAVATQMRARFPEAFAAYRAECLKAKGDGYPLVGNVLLFDAGEYEIASLIVSDGYGPHRDPPDIILQHTALALRRLLDDPRVQGNVFHSPRFNAGLHKVPWSSTEDLLRRQIGTLLSWPIWTVWSP
jgi:ADP-ribose 1''-phosphate phosphatase